jgi:hypothetical protein
VLLTIGVPVGRAVLVGLRVLICACPALAVSSSAASETAVSTPTRPSTCPVPPDLGAMVAIEPCGSRTCFGRSSHDATSTSTVVPATHPSPPGIAN